jgi:soluble lytic murein transglycosylase
VRPGQGLAASNDVETAALVPGLFGPHDQAAMPRPLTAEDAAHYRHIFNLQDQQRWTAADEEIARLESRLLLGHVLAQRYLSPAFRAKYLDLAQWLDKYCDLPESAEIHRIALKRMPRGARAPRKPEGSVFSAAMGAAEDGGPSARHTTSAVSHSLDLRIGKDDYLGAAQILRAHDAGVALSEEDFDDYRAQIVAGLYMQHHDDDGARLTDFGVGRDKPMSPGATWATGLTEFRMKRYGEASARFEAIAKAEQVDSWTRAAGAYWAARSHLLAREPEQFSRWIEIAARYPYSFYGILARRLAAIPLGFNWAEPAFTSDDVHQVMAAPGGMRAVALIQIGQDAIAEQELRRINPAAPQSAHALIAVAGRADMPSLSMQLAEQVLDPEGRHYDMALYPTPSWRPTGGFSVDRALVLALVRQESKFLPTATSHAGARGLMQVMPATARLMSADAPFGGAHPDLFDPQLNLAIGQSYISHLMSTDAVGGNLFLLAASYNGGPGNVARWRREAAAGDDPLLFIESIPSRETRLFVEHVLANYWIYADELGYSSSSVDAVAEGRWPVYHPSDALMVPAAARYGRN